MTLHTRSFLNFEGKASERQQDYNIYLHYIHTLVLVFVELFHPFISESEKKYSNHRFGSTRWRSEEEKKKKLTCFCHFHGKVGLPGQFGPEIKRPNGTRHTAHGTRHEKNGTQPVTPCFTCFTPHSMSRSLRFHLLFIFREALRNQLGPGEVDTGHVHHGGAGVNGHGGLV